MNTKIYFLIFFASLRTCSLHAIQISQIADTTGKRNTVAVGLQLPLGEFNETHGTGINLSYLRSSNRFGLLGEKSATKHDFVYGGAISHFKGKIENEELLASYKYSRFIVVQAVGGIVYNLGKQGNVIFTAGPALAFYDGVRRFNAAANLDASFYFNQKFGVNGGFSLLKETGSGALLTINILGLFSF